MSSDISKIISRKYTVPEITFMMRVSSWKFVRTQFQLEIIIRSTISAIKKFRENILESSQNASETAPMLSAAMTVVYFIYLFIYLFTYLSIYFRTIRNSHG